jgi:hypothetical protein
MKEKESKSNFHIFDKATRTRRKPKSLKERTIKQQYQNREPVHIFNFHKESKNWFLKQQIRFSKYWRMAIFPNMKLRLCVSSNK